MALEGSLSDFGLADILQLIYFQRKTGVLALEGTMDRVRLMFIEGNVTGAESRRRVDDNRLGKILVKKNIIREADLQSALEEQRKSRARLGDILIRSGLVQKEALAEILTSQITETVLQLFGWKQGSYEFAAQTISADKDMPLSIDTQHLLMEGLRVVDEWSAVSGRISLDTVFSRTPAGAERLSEEEADVYQYVDGENDVGTIADLSGRENFEVSKILVSLRERGYVHEVTVAPVEAEIVTQAAPARRGMPGYLSAAAIALSFFLSAGYLLVRGNDDYRGFRAAGDIEELRFRIETYRAEHGSYPASLEAVNAGKDPWGRPFFYRVYQDLYYLASPGPDGREGSGDDIY